MKKLLIALAIIIALTIHFYFMATDWLYRDCVSYFFDLIMCLLWLFVVLIFLMLFFGGFVGVYLAFRYIVIDKNKTWGQRVWGLILMAGLFGLSCAGLDGTKKNLMCSHADMHEIVEDCEYKEQGKCLSWKKYRYSEYTTDE